MDRWPCLVSDRGKDIALQRVDFALVQPPDSDVQTQIFDIQRLHQRIDHVAYRDCITALDLGHRTPGASERRFQCQSVQVESIVLVQLELTPEKPNSLTRDVRRDEIESITLTPV